MKLKIFNTRLLLVCSFMIAHGAFAQTDGDNKEFNKEMQKLQSQLSGLQAKMNKLQVEELKKHSKEIEKTAKQLSVKALANINKNVITGWAKQFSASVNPNVWIVPPVSPESPVPPEAPQLPDFNSDKNFKKLLQDGDVKEKVKTYSKTYQADGNDKLQISNMYGKITVNTWNRNEVKVDVQIKAYANDEAEAQKMLDNINITDSKENSVISFRTNINRPGGSHGNSWVMLFGPGKSSVRKSEINYTIYMPAKIQLQISNRYGSTILPDLAGKVTIDQAYGALQAKSLTNPANEIKVRYGSADIENLVSSDVNVSYGSLKLGEAERLNADVSYGSANIGILKTAGTINARYCGGLQISDVDKSVKNLSVNSSYSNVKLGLPENADADFDVTVHFGNFNYGSRSVKMVNQTDDDKRINPTKTYKGQLGKGNAGKMITIKSNYGNVKFD